MSVAIALRRAGHRVTIYEKHDFAGEVGASVSCAANGTRWLHEWGVDVEKGDPVVLKKLINRDWHTGEPVSTFDLDDYEEKWGYVYNMFHRQYMHRMLKDCAMQEEGEGTPVKLLVNHACQEIDLRTSTVTFKNGVQTQHDLIVGRWDRLSCARHPWDTSREATRRTELPARQCQYRAGGQAWSCGLLTKCGLGVLGRPGRQVG